MGLIESIVLGLVQGLTEFLPVSSSGHLVIFEKLFGVQGGDLVFEVLVHLGTLVAVLIFFRQQLSNILRAFLRSFPGRIQSSEDSKNVKLGWFLVLGTVPAALIGIGLKDYIELAFDSPRWSSGMLLVTALILFSTRWANRDGARLNIARTIIIGFAQALAIMPGISRSGSTISAGMFLGLDKSEAAEFSFLLSIPAILGATVLQIPEFFSQIDNTGLMVNYLAGALVAAVIGYLSISLLMKIIKKGKFFYFGLYCAAVGILGIIFL
ncbi:MAG: undecaprenyl-diphosphate phosphatase [candidate division Zixibacteria bacterium]